MRQHPAFRPRALESLEARAVPSVAGVTVPTGIPGLSVTLPRQVSLANPQVQAAFTAFDRSYVRAVDSILFAAGPDGLVVPSNNRAAFVAAIERSLETFAEQLVASLGTTSTPASPSGANLEVTSAIVGGVDDLEARLLALSLAQFQLSVPNPSTHPAGPAHPAVPNVVDTALVVRPTTRVPVAESTGPASTGADAMSTAVGASRPSSKAESDVRSAFNVFLNDYFRAVQGVLLAPGQGGQTNPPARRADFDARVAQSLRSLEASLTASLARDPATSGLGPQVLAALEGAGPAGLKGQLAGLATPEATQAAVVREFTLGSTRLIARALAIITGDVARPIGR